MSHQNIVLINLKPPYELKASTMRMASAARTTSIVQVLVASETQLFTKDLLQQEYSGKTSQEEDDDEEPTKVPCTADSFTQIFADCHTVILPDSLFVDKSRVFSHTTAFLQHGLKPLQAFYQQGGTVVIQCVEGALSSTCTTQINTTFDTNWKIHVLADAITLGPTDSAKALWNTPYLPQQVIWKDSAFYLACPDTEGLYQIVLPTREEFETSFNAQDELFEKLGIEKDASMDCFDVEKSWQDYISKYSDRYGLAMHTDNTTTASGHVIWYGDRSQTNRTMSFIFCKLLDIGHLGREAEYDEGDFYASSKKGSFPLPNAMVLLAILMVLVAVLAKYLGY